MISKAEIAQIFDECESLNHVPIPFEDLVECVIGTDVREQNPEVADLWTRWVYQWLGWGYSEQQVVDVFYQLVTSVYASEQINGVMQDIEIYLENHHEQ